MPALPRDFTDTTLTASPHIPQWHGLDQEFVYPGRAVIQVPGVAWAFLPEVCTVTVWAWFSKAGEVAADIGEGVALLCLGCGLDGT